MNPSWLKRTLPRGLYGRAALILIVPIVTIQLVVSIMFIQRHFEDVTRQMTGNVLQQLDYLVAQVNAAPNVPSARRQIAALSAPLSLEVTLDPAGVPAAPSPTTADAGSPTATAPAPAGPVPGPTGDRRLFYDLSGRTVILTLHEGLPQIASIDLASSTRQVRIWMGTRHGPMQVVFDRRRASASNPHQLLVLMALTSLLMTGIAYAFLRNQLRPIRQLADAAAEFGKGRTAPYRPSGALEVRAAGSAFLDMRNRIERQIEQRTLMLSGVSHDLRTPLTRLKLGLAMAAEDEDTTAMRRDVADMEGLLDAFLAFARGDAEGDPVPTDPVVLVQGLVENGRRAGQNVRLDAVQGTGTIRLRPVAVSRAVENLVNNAVRYGSQAAISVMISDKVVRITVEDDGPGIDRQRRDEALRPFVRLDSARNQDRGAGVGLGLTIAMDVARSHGGSLRLGESETLGGLKAELVLAR